MVAQAVDGAIRGKYFPDHDWAGLTVTNVLWLLSGLYFVIVAIIGRWKVCP
jgi:hypothetical protein